MDNTVKYGVHSNLAMTVDKIDKSLCLKSPGSLYLKFIPKDLRCNID